MGHGRDVLAGQQVRGRYADEDVRPGQDLLEGAVELGAVGVLGDPAAELVHTLLPGVDSAGTAARDDLAGALDEQEPDDRVPGGTDARHHDAHVLDALVDDPQRVRQRGEHHDGRAVLVVVEHGYVEELAQPGLDLEAARRRDVLQVDAAVDGGHGADDLHQGVGVLGVQADRPGIDAAELLEQGRLALHDGQRGGRPDVAQAEHCRAVGDHGHRVALDGQTSRVLRVLGDGQADSGHAGGVCAGEVVAVFQRHLGSDLDLAAEMHQEGAVAHLAHDRSGDLGDGLGDQLGVLLVRGVTGDVDHHAGRLALNDVKGGERAPRRAHGGGERGRRGRHGRHLDADGDRVAGTG